MNQRRAMMGAAVLCLSSQRPAHALLAMVRWRFHNGRDRPAPRKLQRRPG
jgi:hypothetical protein